ncbi:hypothetical protein LCGC14_1410510, partial [marine sediment metagenome]
MTILENEYGNLEQDHTKDDEEEEEEEDIVNQELDLRNSTIKIKRQKSSLNISILKEDITSIKGVGVRVAEKLKVGHFNTIVGIASTTAERLSQINGIGNALAKRIIEGAKAIMDRKNLQDFTIGKNTSVEEINNNYNNKSSITMDEPISSPTIEPLKKMISDAQFNPWFDQKFKIKRSGGSISPERKKEGTLPIDSTTTNENSLEGEKIEYEEIENYEDEIEVMGDNQNSYAVPKETLKKSEPNLVEKPTPKVETSQKKTIPDEKIDPQEKAVILGRITKTLQAQGYYILKKQSTMKELFAHVDILALKNIYVNEVLEFIIFIPLKVSMLKGKVQISNEVIKYIPTSEKFKKKGSVFKKLIDSYFGNLEECHELIKEELERGTLLSSVNKCLKQEISLKTSITKKNLFFSIGPQQFKMLVEPVLICQGEVGFLEKVTPFAYLKDINLHILAEDNLTELLQFIERKYTLLEKHKIKETSLLPYYETYNQFLKRSELFSIPFIGFAFGLFGILGLQLFQMLGLFLNIGYGLLGIYFITLLFFYMKFFKIKLEVQTDFKTPYFKRIPKLDETSLVLINEEFESELMSQFVYECVDKGTEIGIISNIEEDQITERFHKKQLEKTVKINSNTRKKTKEPEPIGQ